MQKFCTGLQGAVRGASVQLKHVQIGGAAVPNSVRCSYQHT